MNTLSNFLINFFANSFFLIFLFYFFYFYFFLFYYYYFLFRLSVRDLFQLSLVISTYKLFIAYTTAVDSASLSVAPAADSSITQSGTARVSEQVMNTRVYSMVALTQACMPITTDDDTLLHVEPDKLGPRLRLASCSPLIDRLLSMLKV